VVGSGSRKQAANVQKANESKPSVPLQDGIIYVEYGKNTSDTNMKGFNPKKKTKRVPKNTKMSAINTVALRPNGLRNQNNKPFDNQVTLIYRILWGLRDECKGI
jgi:hypothetical protein